MKNAEKKSPLLIVKSSGEPVPFSAEKLKNSLQHSGAEPGVVAAITDQLTKESFEGMTTREIYNRAFALLKKYKKSCASRYKLKKAIYELGPTGFPFEKFISALLNLSGYRARTNVVYGGSCISHEVDVEAVNGTAVTLIECKFHSDEGRKCNVKVPLYIDSRYRDILKNTADNPRREFTPGWVVTNTRFTSDAMEYGKCAGLYLLSWNYPEKDSLKARIDRYYLYPITVSMLLSSREKDFLLAREVVLGKELLKHPHYLDHLGVSDSRKRRILSEFQQLCNPFRP
ncbi:ATPase [Robiginitalea sp. IMCC43444]|uniref:ATPase n=1 Tax=Robiginitalea sp. IMCC43444 TaxID=3459121 RepID=UPI004042DA18